jgi:hypothetical protein
MAPNKRARQNHDALFPNHVSTLATTDPELIDVFDNFAPGYRPAWPRILRSCVGTRHHTVPRVRRVTAAYWYGDVAEVRAQ